jgi:hypothetical protein
LPFLHLFELKLLNFGQARPLLVEQVVNLLMQMPDLEFGFEIDAIVVQRLQACPSSPAASRSS